MSSSGAPFSKLVRFLADLDERRIHHTLAHHREETVMVIVATPGERWEVEFFEDGEVEIEVFRSQGMHGEEALARVLGDSTEPLEAPMNSDDIDERVSERTLALQRSNEDLKAFAYNALHDQRQMVRRLTSPIVEVLTDYGAEMPPAACELLDSHRQAGLNWSNHLDDETARLKICFADLRKVEVNVSWLARQVAEKVRDQASKWGDPAAVEVEGGLVANTEDQVLRFALRCLVQNAVAHSPLDGTVRIGRAEEGAFFISDEGATTAEQRLRNADHTFDRVFPRIEGDIGLLEARRAIDKLGGRLWGNAEPAQGATFYFTLG